MRKGRLAHRGRGSSCIKTSTYDMVESKFRSFSVRSDTSRVTSFSSNGSFRLTRPRSSFDLPTAPVGVVSGGVGRR